MNHRLFNYLSKDVQCLFRMRVALLFISLCFVTAFALAGPTDSDHNSNYEAFENQWQQKVNHTGTAAPSGSFGLPPNEGKGRVSDWYSGGYGGDGFDDSFKPRPYFGAESLFDLYLPDLEERLLELVNYIHTLLEYPLQELKQILLLLSLKELDDLQALRLEQQKQQQLQQAVEALEAVQPPENPASELSAVLWNVYQQKPGSQQDTSQLPGILMAPGLKSGSSGSTGTGERSTGGGGGASGGDASQNTKQSSSEKPGGTGEGSGGDGEKPPASNQHSDSNTRQEQTGLKVTTQITVNYRETFEVNGVLDSENEDLYCGHCKNLVSENGAQCQQCQSYLCFSHVGWAGEGTAECPDCQKDSTFTQVDLSPRINELVWECPRGCGRLYTAEVMEYHLRQNRCSQVYKCVYDQCEFSGTYASVWEHEQNCNSGLESQFCALTLRGAERTKGTETTEDSEPGPSLKCCSQCKAQMTSKELLLHQKVCAPTISYRDHELTFISASPYPAYQMMNKMGVSFVQILLPIATCLEEGQRTLGTFRFDLYWGIETFFVTYQYVVEGGRSRMIVSLFEKDDPPSQISRYARGVSIIPFIPDSHKPLWFGRWAFDPQGRHSKSEGRQPKPKESHFDSRASGKFEMKWINWKIKRLPQEGWFGITIYVDSCFPPCVLPPSP